MSKVNIYVCICINTQKRIHMVYNQANINYKSFTSFHVLLKFRIRPLLINYSGWKPYSPGFFITQS